MNNASLPAFLQQVDVNAPFPEWVLTILKLSLQNYHRCRTYFV